MSGKTIYFTEKELELIRNVFAAGNIAMENSEDEEAQWELVYRIRNKISS